MQLGQIVPDFEATTNEGKISFHAFIGDSWCILFSHPADFTPVCTTELARAAQLAPEFEKRNVKMIALSCNDVLTHLTWIEDIKTYGNINKHSKLPYPIIDDQNRKLAIILNMIDPSDHDKAGLPLTCRAVSFFFQINNILFNHLHNSAFTLLKLICLYLIIIFSQKRIEKYFFLFFSQIPLVFTE